MLVGRQNLPMSLSAQQALYEAEQLLARSSYGGGKSKKRSSSRRRNKHNRRHAEEDDYADMFMQPETNELLDSLPNDLLYQSLTYLWRRDMLHVSLVCKELHNVVAEVAVSLFIEYFGAPHPLHMTKPSIFSMVEKIRYVQRSYLHSRASICLRLSLKVFNSSRPVFLFYRQTGFRLPKTSKASYSGPAFKATTRSSTA